MINYQFHGMNINQVILWFFIYSFCGWCMECVVIRREKGKWENRGFAKLPFCVIYGFGTFLAYNMFAPIQNNLVMLYMAGVVCATIFEFITGVLMIKLFGQLWWNYEHKKFNYKGILCLESSIAWGFLSVFIFGVFDKYIQYIVTSLNGKIAIVLSVILATSYIADFSYHFTKRIFDKNNNDAMKNTL